MILVELLPLALGIVEFDPVVDALRIHAANVEEFLLALHEAHLAHARVKLEAGALHSASLKVDERCLVAHDLSVSSTDHDNLCSFAHLTPRESSQTWC